LLAAFGAWIGAGAAYFFGRENLRVATQGILQAGGRTPEEILSATSIGDVPPRPLEWTVRPETPLKDVVETLDRHPGYWFIPVVKSDGALETVLDQEAVWRHIAARAADNTPFAEAVGQTVSVLYASDADATKNKTPFVVMNRDRSVGDAYAAMEDRDIRLAIVTDERGKPTSFITTGDIRRVLLRKARPAR
jgi:CBS domain-containing protein